LPNDLLLQSETAAAGNTKIGYLTQPDMVNFI